MAVSSPNEVTKLLLAWSEALTRLAILHPRQGQVVEMRYFGGSSQEEVATALKVSLRTVQEDWRVARLWLFRELRGGE